MPIDTSISQLFLASLELVHIILTIIYFIIDMFIYSPLILGGI